MHDLHLVERLWNRFIRTIRSGKRRNIRSGKH